MFGERGLSSKYISIAQYLASTKKGLAAATNMQGEDFWFTVLQGWEGVKSAHVAIGERHDSCQLTIVDVNGGTARPRRSATRSTMWPAITRPAST